MQGSTNLKHGNWVLEFFTVDAFSLRNCQRSHPPCLLALILKWRKESNSEKQREYWKINTLNLWKALPLSYLVRCCGCFQKKKRILEWVVISFFSLKYEDPLSPSLNKENQCNHTCTAQSLWRLSKITYASNKDSAWNMKCKTVWFSLLFLSVSLSWVQFSCSVISDSLWPHELQHDRLPCTSPTYGAYSNSCPSNQWCHPTISSSVIPFSSSLQSFLESGSFQMSQFFASGGQSIGVSASASSLPMNIQDWFPLGWTGWISLQAKRLSRVFSNTTVQKHQFFSAYLSL